MAVQPESSFIQRINKNVSPEVYREKMHNPYRGGTPDVWYSGTKSDLWVEYKFINKEIKHSFTADLSALQTRWLRKRFDEGRTVAVIVGYKGGGFIFNMPDDWEAPHLLANTPFHSNTTISEWINNVCIKVLE